MITASEHLPRQFASIQVIATEWFKEHIDEFGFWKHSLDRLHVDLITFTSSTIDNLLRRVETVHAPGQLLVLISSYEPETDTIFFKSFYKTGDVDIYGLEYEESSYYFKHFIGQNIIPGMFHKSNNMVHFDYNGSVSDTYRRAWFSKSPTEEVTDLSPKQKERTKEFFKVYGTWNKSQDIIDFGSTNGNTNSIITHEEITHINFKSQLKKTLKSGIDPYFVFENGLIFGIAKFGEVYQSVNISVDSDTTPMKSLDRYEYYNLPLGDNDNTIEHFFNMVKHNSKLITNSCAIPDNKAVETHEDFIIRFMKNKGMVFKDYGDDKKLVEITIDEENPIKLTDMLIVVLMSIVDCVKISIKGNIFIFMKMTELDYDSSDYFESNDSGCSLTEDTNGYLVSFGRQMSFGVLNSKYFFKEENFDNAIEFLFTQLPL